VPVRISSDDTLFFLGGNFHPAKTEKGCGRHPREGRQTAQIRVPDLHQCSPPKNQVIIKRACEKAGIEVELNEALSKGIVISGLPITVKEPFYSTMDIDNLDWYYEDCVIGGPGSFVIPIKDREKFKEAIRAKFLLEIAGRTLERRIVPAAEKESRVPCLIGEKLWEDRWGR
jgi:Protein of unknown function (DUF1194)